MQNPNHKIMEIDDRPKGRAGIEEMLARMEKLDVSAEQEHSDHEHHEAQSA